MRSTKKKLRDRIINRINSLTREKLKSVDEFIDDLEGVKHSKKKILSYSGVWKDMDSEVFQDLIGHKRIL